MRLLVVGDVLDVDSRTVWGKHMKLWLVHTAEFTNRLVIATIRDEAGVDHLVARERLLRNEVEHDRMTEHEVLVS